MKIDDYNALIEILLKEYNSLCTRQLTDEEQYNPGWIARQQDNLRAKRYLVSFSGQIKAGKSTLINALIFGEEVLPADDLPHTAKITIIRYGEQPALDVLFYAEHEWTQLCEQPADETTYKEKYLRKDIERSARKGVYPAEIIQPKARRMQVQGTEELHDFVAAKGTYTPFVNEVIIRYPAEILKTVEFVDTPGTNDPNIFRSRLTEKWISQANANIYVTYVNRALDSIDIEFIDRYLLHVPTSKRLITVNKADLIESCLDLDEWLQELQQNEDLKLRGIFSDASSIYYTSGLGGLIASYLESGKPLPEELEEYREMLEPKGYLAADKNGIAEFLSVIEEKICADVGLSVLQSHRSSILGIYQKRLEDLELNINRLLEKRKNSHRTEEEIENRKRDLENTIARADGEFKKSRDKIESHFDGFGNELRKLMCRHKDLLYSNIEPVLRRIKNISHFRNEVNWIVKRTVESDLANLYPEVKKTFEFKLRKPVEEDLNEFTELYKNIFSEQALTLLVRLPLHDVMNSIIDESETIFGADSVETITMENTKFFQRLINTKGGRENLISALSNKINNFLDEQYGKNIRDKFVDLVKLELKKYVKNIEENLKKHTNTLYEDIVMMEEKRKATGDLKHNLNVSIDKCKNRRSEIQGYIDDFQENTYTLAQGVAK